MKLANSSFILEASFYFYLTLSFVFIDGMSVFKSVL